MQKMKCLYIIFVSLATFYRLAADDGIYESVTKVAGEEHKLSRPPKTGASVYFGELVNFVTDQVIVKKEGERQKVVWVGRFLDKIPNGILVKLDGSIFSMASKMGPGKLTKEGTVSNRGVEGRYKVTFYAKDNHEAFKLVELLEKQGLNKK